MRQLAGLRSWELGVGVLGPVLVRDAGPVRDWTLAEDQRPDKAETGQGCSRPSALAQYALETKAPWDRWECAAAAFALPLLDPQHMVAAESLCVSLAHPLQAHEGPLMDLMMQLGPLPR